MNEIRKKTILTDKKCKEVVTRMLTELGKRINEHCEIFNKELENTKKTQSDMKNLIVEIGIKKHTHTLEKMSTD